MRYLLLRVSLVMAGLGGLACPVATSRGAAPGPSAAGTAAHGVPDARPHVLFIAVDDLPGYGRWLAYERTGNHAEVLRLEQWELAVQAYLASIAFTDAMLGRVLEALDASPYAKNTIIVLWSDHGMHLGEKQHWTKWGLWEQATRAPLIIVAPGVTTPGGRCDTPVSLLDLYPTLIELCGLPLPPRPALEGESLVPLLRDPKAERTAPAITTHGHMNHAIRTARWRYIRYRDGSEELYDHQADPREWKNLAGYPRYAEVIAELQQWLPEVNVPDPPYLERTQYWPGDPAPDDVSDYPRVQRAEAEPKLPPPAGFNAEPGLWPEI